MDVLQLKEERSSLIKELDNYLLQASYNNEKLEEFSKKYIIFSDGKTQEEYNSLMLEHHILSTKINTGYTRLNEITSQILTINTLKIEKNYVTTK